MSEINDNIEHLFQDRFDGFEANVDPSVWEAVQSNLPKAGTGSPTPDAGMAQAGGKVIFGQFSTATVVTITSIAASLLVAFGVYQYMNETETPVHQKEELVDQGVAPVLKQNEDKVVLEKGLVKNNIENADVPAQPEVVKNDPEVFEKAPLKNQNIGSDPVLSSGPPESELAKDEDNNEVPVEKQTLPSINTPEEQLVNSEPAQIQQNTEDGLAHKTPEPPAPEEIFAGIEFEKIAGQPFSYKFKNAGQGSRFEWDMGDGAYAIVDDPEHTFDRPGEYTVKLTVHAQDGRYITDEVTLKVFEPSELILPDLTALSPNGDHINDTYDLDGRNIQKVSIQVLNFSGESVFTSDSFDKDWDGNDNNGRPLPPGRYPVIIEALGYDSVPHTKKTFVSLYR